MFFLMCIPITRQLPCACIPEYRLNTWTADANLGFKFAGSILKVLSIEFIVFVKLWVQTYY